jgi:hypothetical protein
MYLTNRERLSGLKGVKVKIIDSYKVRTKHYGINIKLAAIQSRFHPYHYTNFTNKPSAHTIMSPIKVGLVGLSSRSKSQWGPKSHLPYFLSARGKEKFQIVAVQNSSTESAQQAIKDFGLPPTARAYGSPEEMAADPDVQLVVNLTGVLSHYPGALPSIKAGKDAFIEWPLADSLEHVREIVALASDKKIRTGVGLQGRFAPPFVKIKDVLASGQYGKVLSSEIKAAFPPLPRDTLPVGWDFFAAKKYSVNAYTIGFGHCEFSSLSTKWMAVRLTVCSDRCGTINSRRYTQSSHPISKPAPRAKARGSQHR